MSAVEMVDSAKPVEEVGHFVEWLSENGITVTRDSNNLMVGAASDIIYGPVVGANLEYYRSSSDPTLAVAAARILCDVSLKSSEMYDADYYGVREGLFIDSDGAFQQAMRETQRAMAEGGQFKFMPAKYAMTPDEGKLQVMHADRVLGKVSSDVPRLLAEANYSIYFSGQTMADAADMLSTSISESIAATTPAKMPHLKRTNFAIGQLLGSFAENKDKNGRLMIVDCGTGSGATLAAGLSELSRTAYQHDYQNISVFGVEPNPAYSEGLRRFAPAILQAIQSINPAFELVTTDTDIQAERTNTLSLVEADILNVIADLDLSSMCEKDVAVMTANYVWHRLPSAAKVRMIGQIKAKASNGIFVIGDLESNASVINRQYFNFGNNGPLNTGNRGLGGMFAFHELKVIKLGADQAPKCIDPALAASIANESGNDGSFWIAYYGQEAERLVKAA